MPDSAAATAATTASTESADTSPERASDDISAIPAIATTAPTMSRGAASANRWAAASRTVSRGTDAITVPPTRQAWEPQ